MSPLHRLRIFIGMCAGTASHLAPSSSPSHRSSSTPSSSSSSCIFISIFIDIMHASSWDAAARATYHSGRLLDLRVSTFAAALSLRATPPAIYGLQHRCMHRKRAVKAAERNMPAAHRERGSILACMPAAMLIFSASRSLYDHFLSLN